MFLSAASLHTFSLSIGEDEMSSLFLQPASLLPLQLSSSYCSRICMRVVFSSFPVLPCENFLSIVPSEKITMWQYWICIIKRASAEDYVSVLMIDPCRCERGEGEQNKSRLLSKLHLHKKWKSVAEEQFAVALHVCSVKTGWGPVKWMEIREWHVNQRGIGSNSCVSFVCWTWGLISQGLFAFSTKKSLLNKSINPRLKQTRLYWRRCWWKHWPPGLDTASLTRGFTGKSIAVSSTDQICFYNLSFFQTSWEKASEIHIQFFITFYTFVSMNFN